jgi:hypothetical protein
MKYMLNINIGSIYFFSSFLDIHKYSTHDKDKLIVLDNKLPNNIPVLNYKDEKNDVFIYSNLTKEE